MEFKRPYIQHLKKRAEEDRKFIQVLSGPRQVGKTTLIQQLCASTSLPYILTNADNVSSASTTWIDQQWEAARIKYHTEKPPGLLLIIDEIQKISNWSESVKKHWDTDTQNKINIKLILLGSSGLLLHKGLNESLTGRFELIEIPHWSYKEMRDSFGLSPEEYAWFGAYPGAIELRSDEPRFKDYIRHSIIESTVSKDILMLHQIHKPALLRQVFELGVLYSSKVLSYSKMIGQLQDAGNTTTVANYLRLLDIAGIVAGIPKYYGEIHRTKGSTPKWQTQNMAFFSALSQQSFAEAQRNPVFWGQVVESVIATHLIQECKKNHYKLYYWRHRNEEVDFVIVNEDKVIGLEVKSGAAKPTKGMRSFLQKYQPYKVLMVGNEGIQWQDFLSLDLKFLF